MVLLHEAQGRPHYSTHLGDRASRRRCCTCLRAEEEQQWRSCALTARPRPAPPAAGQQLARSPAINSSAPMLFPQMPHKASPSAELGSALSSWRGISGAPLCCSTSYYQADLPLEWRVGSWSEAPSKATAETRAPFPERAHLTWTILTTQTRSGRPAKWGVLCVPLPPCGGRHKLRSAHLNGLFPTPPDLPSP